jgi:hypothetical protein
MVPAFGWMAFGQLNAWLGHKSYIAEHNWTSTFAMGFIAIVEARWLS